MGWPILLSDLKVTEMNKSICVGTFSGMKEYYVSEDGGQFFNFEFFDAGSHIDIYCNDHPSLNGQDSDPHKTHLYRSGKLCFSGGKEPQDMLRARELAKQWAEYFLEYVRTGSAQS